MNQAQFEESKRHDCKVIDGIYIGTLKSPAEVAQAMSARSEVPPGISRWTLCGDVDPVLFASLNACGHPQQRNERLSVFSGESGVKYAVISHQAGSFQHRYLAPLFDSKMVACVKAVAHGDALGYLLGGEGSQAAVWRSQFSMREFLPILPMCSETPQGGEERVLQEYFGTLLELKHPERIPSSIEGVPVLFASVSGIAPDALIEKVGGWRGLQNLIGP